MASLLSLPSARPYEFKFPIETTALIIIDMQRDFIDPGGFGSIQCGNPEVFSRARAIVPTVQKVLGAFRSIGAHVIHTREGHQTDLADLPAAKRLSQISAPNGHHDLGISDKGPNGRLLVRGEYGHDIIDELTPWPGEAVIDKPGKGSFWGTDLHRVLLSRGITHLLFTGVTTEQVFPPYLFGTGEPTKTCFNVRPTRCCVTTTVRECNDRGYESCILSDCTTGFNAKHVTTSMDIICSQDGLFGFVSRSSDLLSALAELPKVPSTPQVPLEKLPPIDELAHLYKCKAITPVDVVNLVHDIIRKYEDVDQSVWITRETREACLESAKELMNKYADKPLPPLYGVPFSVKDSIDVAGVQTSAACPSFAYTPLANAPVIQHLLDAGAIYIGKVNLDQLATGLSGYRSPYGVPRSVYSSRHISGGSSSGSAVSVGAGLVSFALGTDTAGSGRVPACFNGVVGLKPTKGTISARGVVPACKTLDTVTVVAPSVREARKIWQILDHHDRHDPFAKPPQSLPTWHADFRGMKAGGFTFAVPPAQYLKTCSSEYRDLFAKAIQTLRSCGGRLVEVDYAIFDEAGELLYNGSLLHERLACIGLEFLEANLDSLHPVTKELFSRALATAPTAHQVFQDQIKQRTLTWKAQQTFDVVNGGIDTLVVPTTTRHPTYKEMEADPISLNSELGTFTHFGNVVDLCGIHVPAGEYQTKDGSGARLPFGVTLLGGSGYDAKILDIAALCESAYS